MEAIFQIESHDTFEKFYQHAPIRERDEARTDAKIIVDDIALEQVNEIVCIGCAYSWDGRYTTDIERRVLGEILKNLYYSAEATNTKLDVDIINKAKEEIRTTITECNFNIQNVIESFHNKSGNEGRLDYFKNLLEQNWSEILVAALNNYNSSYGESVINFDWLVKFVIGTSELKTLKYPLLQLILSTVTKSGQHNNVMYDVNKDVLMKLINALENKE